MSVDNPLGQDNGDVPANADHETSFSRSRPQTLKVGLIAALAVIVALGVLVAFLLVRSPSVSSSAHAEPAPAPTRSSVTATATARPTMSAKPTAAPAVPPVAVQPAPPAPPAPPVPPAPPAPPAVPVLPAPPAPVIPPLSIKDMSTSVSDGCTSQSKITLSWIATGALINSTEVRVRSGGGTPVFDQIWSGLPASGSDWFNLDCTRPIWYFTLTVTNGTGTKKALLTFANGKTAGWSPIAP